MAIQQARATASSIIDTVAGRPRKHFRYSPKGTLATIGRSAAVADFGAIRLSGFLAWLSWLFIHIFSSSVFATNSWLCLTGCGITSPTSAVLDLLSVAGLNLDICVFHRNYPANPPARQQYNPVKRTT